MNDNLKSAEILLKNGGYTLAAVRGEEKITSTLRGVRPLLDILDGGSSLAGFSAADKVVGKAAAFLYVLLKPKELFAAVISRPALDVLEKYGVAVEYTTLTEAIRNRANTGFCPMETAVRNVNDPAKALEIIRKTAEKLSK